MVGYLISVGEILSIENDCGAWYAGGTTKRGATSCINMLHVMYLWIPMLLSLCITFIMSRMNVEGANEKLRAQMESAE